MQILNIFHVLIAISMIAFILVQKGAGATAGAAFGSGASGTVFGSRGAGNFLSRSTWVLATLFCLISLSMAVILSRSSLSPETDLGVVAAAPVIEQSSQQTSADLATDLPLATEVVGPSDLPEIETLLQESAQDGTAGDLPVVGSAEQSDDSTGDDAVGDDT